MSGTELSGEAELEQLQERSFSYFLHETEVRTLADALYRRVDWVWALNNGKTLTHGWRPED
ncbi:MAG TPA: hypothetical protein VL091_06835, partial [Marinobacter sp.]|nr:hypothetical protein [Marinobacter sp.]